MTDNLAADALVLSEASLTLVRLEADLERQTALRERAERKLQKLRDQFESEFELLIRTCRRYEAEKIAAFSHKNSQQREALQGEAEFDADLSWEHWIAVQEANHRQALNLLERDLTETAHSRLETRERELTEAAHIRLETQERELTEAAHIRLATQERELTEAGIERLNFEAVRNAAEIAKLNSFHAETTASLSAQISRLHLEARSSQEAFRKEAYRFAVVLALRTSEAERARGDAVAASQRLDLLLSSTSWRYGRPIRGLGRLFRFLLRIPRWLGQITPTFK